MLVRSWRRSLASSSSVFPGIEWDRDEKLPYIPAPLRNDKHEDEAETIREQSKGSAMRLLKDRFVDDGGYLQSRTPFPLKQPHWKSLDTNRPEMTEEGQLWEDINHFVDYLTCRDVTLAHDLNQMLLDDPKGALYQFGLMLQVMNRPLCRHEVMGKGYIFTREPVLSPSDRVGRLVLQKKVDEFAKGMQYLWILDANLVEHQRNVVFGMELEKMEKSCFLLLDAFRTLHESAAWTEAHFVEALQEMAIFYPSLASWLHEFPGHIAFANLLTQKKHMLRRFVDIQRLTESQIASVELLGVMGLHPELLLNSADSIFQCFISQVPTFADYDLDWMESLRLCRALFAMWQQTNDTAEEFVERIERLRVALPDAFGNSLRECLLQSEDEWMEGSLSKLLQNLDAVLNRRPQELESHSELIGGLPALLLLNEIDAGTLVSNLDVLCQSLGAMDLYGPISIESLLRLQPSAAENPTAVIDVYNRVWPVICAAVSQEEIALVQNHLEMTGFIALVQKLNAVIEILFQEQRFSQKQIEDLFKQKADRVRKWRRNSSIPPELIDWLRKVPASEFAAWISMHDDDLQKWEQSLFLLFGTSPSSVFSNLALMPELSFDKETRDLAVAVGRCCKVTRSDLRKENFRAADERMALLIQTLKRIRCRSDVDEEQALRYLELLAERNLLAPVASQITSLQLMQFCILCVEHPGAWVRFDGLMDRLHHPLLQEVKPRVMHSIKTDAFLATLKAPEIFLIGDLWDQMIQSMKRDQWTFAGMDIDEVEATEPCVFYYAVQHLWKTLYERNAEKLMQRKDNKSTAKVVRRRGKSVVNIQRQSSPAAV